MDLARRMGATVSITSLVGFGFPDLVIGFRGINVLVEVKPPGKDLRDDQKTFHKGWKGQVAVVESQDDLIKLLMRIDHETPTAGRYPAAAGLQPVQGGW